MTFNIFKTIANAPKRAGLGLSAAAIMAMAFIQPWEGREYVPYLDVGGVLTVCDGHTGPDIVKDKTYTDEECDALLAADIAKHEKIVRDNLKVSVADETMAAFISFQYNTGGFKTSTLLKLANQGDIRGACDQLSRWVFVKGVIIKGLVNRRMSEKALCLEGVKPSPTWWGA